ncbi:hypothetical protein NCAS_0A04460 [Naumovozyma castellii]|uniref:GH16 domain-containing protein n=1 Tax=Naumovozyma castellii TaxID=27288 RepID=G0V6B2_NAUCA|nr:hypothetical protein NCAS_0A04460 [Naumovozyma castellii CBS 4309]CCC67004.1 hypothetical protein NCAS_0A04460 [Naumovozyma castellii CBS 4309]
MRATTIFSALLTSASLVLAQENKALASIIDENFHVENSLWDFDDESDNNATMCGSDGLTLTIAESGDSTDLFSEFYILYGRIEAIVKAGNARSISSSIQFFSAPGTIRDGTSQGLFAIDWDDGEGDEFYTFSTAMNSNKNISTQWETHYVKSPQTEYHNYTIDWTKEKLTFYVDGRVVRVVPSTATADFPNSPVKFFITHSDDGDPENASAEYIDMHGGETDYFKGPFIMNIKKLIVADYSTGSNYSYVPGSNATLPQANGGEIYGRYDQAQRDLAALHQNASLSSSYSVSSASSNLSSVTTFANTSTISQSLSTHSTELGSGNGATGGTTAHTNATSITSVGSSNSSRTSSSSPSSSASGAGSATGLSSSLVTFIFIHLFALL